MITVRIPATSANLGCGFDCVGIALDRYMYVSFEEIDEGIEWIGVEEMYQSKENLIYRALEMGLKHLNGHISGVRITVKNPLPVSRGLGSSAACTVAGLYGAYALTHTSIDKETILELSTLLEGHPDNVAPAIFGGLQASCIVNDRVYHSSYTVDSRYRFLTIVPNIKLSTAKARQALPKNIEFHDAVQTLCRLGVTLKAWEEYDITKLKMCMQDWIHEPYRTPLIEEYDKVKEICRTIDSVCLMVSGSGSTILNVIEDSSNATCIQQQLDQLQNEWKVQVCKCDTEGAIIC